MYAISGMMDIRAWDLIYDILFLDPITTPHFAQFQWLWRHRLENSGDNFQWWNLFKGFLGGCFGKTQEQMNHYRADNPSQFGDHGEDRLPPARGHSISRPRRTPCTPTWFPGIPKIAPPYHQVYPPARFLPMHHLSAEHLEMVRVPQAAVSDHNDDGKDTDVNEDSPTKRPKLDELPTRVTETRKMHLDWDKAAEAERDALAASQLVTEQQQSEA
jgi:hypothetical protein